MQHVELSLHGRIPLVLLPVRRVLLASGSIGMSLDIPAPNGVQPISCALPGHHASCFALSHSVFFLLFFLVRGKPTSVLLPPCRGLVDMPIGKDLQYFAGHLTSVHDGGG